MMYLGLELAIVLGNNHENTGTTEVQLKICMIYRIQLQLLSPNWRTRMVFMSSF